MRCEMKTLFISTVDAEKSSPGGKLLPATVKREQKIPFTFIAAHMSLSNYDKTENDVQSHYASQNAG